MILPYYKVCVCKCEMLFIPGWDDPPCFVQACSPALYLNLDLKVIYARFPLAGIDVIVKFLLTCSPLTYSMALDAYHIDSVTTSHATTRQQ